MELLSPQIEADFEGAGWFPGRRVEVPQELSALHPATAALREVGDLRVGAVGSGGSDIDFTLPPVRDLFGNDAIEAWQTLLDTPFISIAEYHDGHGQLWLDGKGRLFSSGLVAPGIAFQGHTFAEGVENILRPKHLWPMLLPWQTEVTLQFQTFRAGDPQVLTVDFFNVR
jgi:hypothetical protein